MPNNDQRHSPTMNYTKCPASNGGSNNGHCFCGTTGNCCFCQQPKLSCVTKPSFSEQYQQSIENRQTSSNNYSRTTWTSSPTINTTVYPLTPGCVFTYYGLEYTVPPNWSQTKINQMYLGLDKAGLMLTPPTIPEQLIEDDGSYEIKD